MWLPRKMKDLKMFSLHCGSWTWQVLVASPNRLGSSKYLKMLKVFVQECSGGGDHWNMFVCLFLRKGCLATFLCLFTTVSFWKLVVHYIRCLSNLPSLRAIAKYLTRKHCWVFHIQNPPEWINDQFDASQQVGPRMKSRKNRTAMCWSNGLKWLKQWTSKMALLGEELPAEGAMGGAYLEPRAYLGYCLCQGPSHCIIAIMYGNLEDHGTILYHSWRCQGGVLHVVSEIRFRWVGWSIAAAVLVLALTFMSNRPLGSAQ